eukprot:2253493-Pyramimonas_sp.AAC.1
MTQGAQSIKTSDERQLREPEAQNSPAMADSVTDGTISFENHPHEHPDVKGRTKGPTHELKSPGRQDRKKPRGAA